MRWTLLALLPLALLAGCLGDDDSDDDEQTPPADDTPSAPLFFDGAESGTGAWTMTSNVVVLDFSGNAPPQETEQAHPEGTWTVSTEQAHNGTSSWYSRYPDGYRTRLMATLEVPEGGGVFSYWYKGGAEDNAVDGLHVLVGGNEVAYHTGPAVDWTQVTLRLSAGTAAIEFRFDSDPSCSNMSPPNPPGDPSGMLCGAGWDAGGFYLDDIQLVAAA